MGDRRHQWKRIYDRLLSLYPAEFRDEYGKEMVTDFNERVRTESPLSLWSQILVDLAITAPKEHMDMLLQDLRYAFHSMRRAPAFAGVITLTLALGIGANTAIFSVVHAVLLRSLPYRDSAKLAIIWSPNRLLNIGLDELPTSAGDFYDWQTQNRSFSEMAGFRGRPFNLSGTGDIPIRVNAITASGDFFHLFGISPALGRPFTREEDSPGKRQVAVLSDALWRRQFGADPNIIGKSIQLNGEAHTVIGVMPREMRFPQGAELPAFYGFATQPDVWVPFGFGPEERRNRGSHNILVVARLRPDVSPAQAQSEMEALQAHIAGDHADGSRGWGAHVVSLREQSTGSAKRTLLILLAAVSLVLLIACANVANLLLARASARRKEIAVRQALGAGRVRLVRQLLTESVVFSFSGGLAGLLLAAGLTRTIVLLSPPGIPRIEQIAINGWVLAFSACLSVVTGVLFGLVPAFQISRVAVADSLKQGGSRGSVSSGDTARRLFVVAEVTLAVILLIGAGLLVRSFIRVLGVEPGFEPASALVMEVGLPPAKYRDASAQSAFFDRALARLRNIPGVQTVGAVSSLPLTNNESLDTLSVEGQPQRPGEALTCDTRLTGGAYFEAMGIPLLHGRLLTLADQMNTLPVAVINETLARQTFPGRDPIGQRMRFGDKQPWMTIVGIVGDVRNTSIEQKPRPQIYLPYHQAPTAFLNIVLRTAVAPATLTGAVRREIATLDPDQAVANIRTMEQVISAAVATRRFITLLLTLFAVLALLLSAIGLYGVVSYTVARRTGEMGLRMALGATRGRLLGMIVGQGLRLTLIGIALGLGGAAALKKLIESLLFGVNALDPWSFGGAALALLLVTALGCFLPARRAANTDPLKALRQE